MTEMFLSAFVSVVIYSTERVEFFVSCLADINNRLIKGKLIINSCT